MPWLVALVYRLKAIVVTFNSMDPARFVPRRRPQFLIWRFEEAAQSLGAHPGGAFRDHPSHRRAFAGAIFAAISFRQYTLLCFSHQRQA